MKASWEKIEKNQGVLTVEVEIEQVAQALDKAFKKVAAKVNVPGFRKGKVPRRIFEARFGVESLYQDAIDFILPEAYSDAVKETGIQPVDSPEVDFEAFEKGNPFTFTAKVVIKPEVELGDYKGLEVEKLDDSVSDEDVDAELEKMQDRHAELVVLEEGTAENGDVAVIDFEGFVDGEAFEGGKGESYSLEIGSGTFIPGFEEQVVGMSKGDEKDVEVTFPENYQSQELAGKAAVFKVKVQDIKRKVLPELDDEFAKDVSEFETLEEYKEDIKKNLQEQKQKENEQAAESAVVDKAVANAEVDIPEAMVKNETTQMLQDFGNRLRYQGMNLEMYYQYSGQNEEALREQMKDDAEKRVRSNLVLEAIAKAENIEVGDEELEDELATLSKTYQQTPEQLKNMLESSGRLDDLKFDLSLRKTVKYLVEQSKPVEAAAKKTGKSKAAKSAKKEEKSEEKESEEKE